MKYVPLRKAVDLFGIKEGTLRKYAQSGQIKAKRSPGNRWLFEIDESDKKSAIICYCRVSSIKQKDDLARQVVFMRDKFPQAQIIQDVGSGLNFKRKGLNSILERLLQQDKLTLVVAHKDRLARFGTELIEYLIRKNGGELLVLDKNELSPEQELTQDLLAILTVFSCRMHGLRSYYKKIKEDKNLSNDTAEDCV